MNEMIDMILKDFSLTIKNNCSLLPKVWDVVMECSLCWECLFTDKYKILITACMVRVLCFTQGNMFWQFVS